MKSRINILHLEDSALDSELIHLSIEDGGIRHEYFLAENEEEFKQVLSTEKINIILSDYSIPGYSGIEAMKFARENYSYMPFIFVSGTMGEDIAIEAMLSGVTDYVIKSRLDRLVPAIKRAVREYDMQVKNKLAEAALFESERKYKELVNEVNDGYFITNEEGLITFANISLAKILGFTGEEEITGHFFHDFNNAFVIEKTTYPLKEFFERNTLVDGLEMEFLRPDGISVCIEMKAIPVIKDGKVTGMQGVIRDITERNRAKVKLLEKNEQIASQNERYLQLYRELAFQNEKIKIREGELIIANRRLTFHAEDREKRANELILVNKELAFQNEEKEKRASELIIANILKATEEKYKLLIEEKNKNITNSINYARLIQQAKLPKNEEIFASIPKCFVLYKPKDIVSGDFYYFHKNCESVFIIAADCTGHGVPGALLSMIGSEKLSEAFSQSTDTSEILKLLNNGIKSSLHQSNSRAILLDGMEVAICSIDFTNEVLKYAGANIPLWLIRNGNSEVIEIKGNSEEIGGFTRLDQHFKSHEIKLMKGDTFYISTDGYADQFNGENGRKLMRNKFKKILVEIQDKSMSEQGKFLDSYIECWKDGNEQIDDILVIGVKV